MVSGLHTLHSFSSICPSHSSCEQVNRALFPAYRLPHPFGVSSPGKTYPHTTSPLEHPLPRRPSWLCSSLWGPRVAVSPAGSHKLIPSRTNAQGPVERLVVTLPPLQELVSRLLHLHFRDGKTKGAGASRRMEGGGREGRRGHIISPLCSQRGRTAAHGGAAEDLRHG
jgi:hypothetical protein